MSTLISEAVIRHRQMDEIAAARRQSDDLFAIVHADALYDRPIPERHRIVFYIGHLEAFDWNLLHERVFGVASFRPEFDNLFAFGIDPVGGGLPNDQPSEWPSMADVKDYVQKSRAALDEKLHDALHAQNESDRHTEDDLSLGDLSPGDLSLNTLLNVAIEHRLMHAETLAYMLHQLPLDRKIRQMESPMLYTVPVEHHAIEISAGQVNLGLHRTGGRFGWDNEFEAHTVDVPAFSIDKYKVTNGQYLEFIKAGGYENSKLWADADWNWISQNKISHPAFWKRDGSRWLYRTMFNDVALPLEWPVYASQAEAGAFAKWEGKSLPTEAEWQRAAHGAPDGKQRSYPWGNEAPSQKSGNFDFHRWNPTPVNAHPAGKSAFGVEGMVGNGWEWTSTPFAAFPGFEAFSFYPGYSANFFDGQHFVMKGGSTRTAACMLRPTFRNWFQAHYQYIYTGFRCVTR